MEPEVIEHEFYIGQIFYAPYPPEAAYWCDNNNATIVEKHKEEETEDGVVDVRYYEIIERPEQPTPTHEEVRKMRADAYQQEKDPITCQIQSLRDEEQTEEVVEEINALIEERKAVVVDIRKRYPYPDEEIVESDLVI